MPLTTSIISNSQLYKIINYTFFQINNELLINGEKIFEYDIQYYLKNAFKLFLKNKNFAVIREKNQVDITIRKFYQRQKTINIPIEIKTFIKNKETISFSKIKSDIIKIEKLKKSKNEKYENGLMIIAISEEKLRKTKGRNKLFCDFLTDTNNLKSRTSDLPWKVMRSHYLSGGKNSVLANQIRLFVLVI